MTRRHLNTLLLALLPFLAVIPTAGAAQQPDATQTRADARQHNVTSILADIQQATWIRDGKSKHVIYVFFDPNCPYCHKVFEMLRPQVQSGAVELRWVPIGKLMLTSLGKAAALLEDKDPTAALYRNERDFSRETGAFGGIEEEPLPREDTLRRLNANHALLRRSGNDGVPALLYRTKEGKANLVVGAPPAATLDAIVKSLE